LYSLSLGLNTIAGGESGIAIGRGYDVAGSGSDRPLLASGTVSINMSQNTVAQTSGHGALAANSLIIGGINHNIPSNSTRSVIIGGNAIKALSADTDTVYMPKVRIGWGTGGALTSGSTSNDVIVRSTGGLLQTRTVASIIATASGVTEESIVVITSATTLSNTTSKNVLVDHSAPITVTLPASPNNGRVFTIKDVSGAALTNNITIAGNGNNIDGSSSASINTNYGSLKLIYSLSLDEWYTMAYIA
jgi:hypothetical protein